MPSFSSPCILLPPCRGRTPHPSVGCLLFRPAFASTSSWISTGSSTFYQHTPQLSSPMALFLSLGISPTFVFPLPVPLRVPRFLLVSSTFPRPLVLRRASLFAARPLPPISSSFPDLEFRRRPQLPPAVLACRVNSSCSVGLLVETFKQRHYTWPT